MKLNLHITTDTADGNAGVMLSRVKAGAAACDRDVEAVERFCAGLNGYTWRNYVQNAPNTEVAPLPPGYRNVRVFDRRDGTLLRSLHWLGSTGARAEVGAGYKIVSERPTAWSIVVLMLGLLYEEVTEWRSTVALPDSEPGTLDLEVDVDTRPRETIMADMPMPVRLIEHCRRNARVC